VSLVGKSIEQQIPVHITTRPVNVSGEIDDDDFIACHSLTTRECYSCKPNIVKIFLSIFNID
jgi:hypothetical protein